MTDFTSKLNIIRYRNGVKENTDDSVVNEITLDLSINFRNLTSLSCSPQHLEDLAAGYLVSSGIISETNPLKELRFESAKNIMHIDLADNSVIKDMIFSKMRPVGCGTGTLLFAQKNISVSSSRVKIRKEKISELMNEFNRSSEVFRETGGVHSAAISDGQNILVMREDIGRHNAIDKVIGYLYRRSEKIGDKIVLTSGRMSSEIVLKAVYSGISVIISRSAPTARAIEAASESGITLVGFARSANFNIYTNFNRVVF